jgi:hypothetical protein
MKCRPSYLNVGRRRVRTKYCSCHHFDFFGGFDRAIIKINGVIPMRTAKNSEERAPLDQTKSAARHPDFERMPGAQNVMNIR